MANPFYYTDDEKVELQPSTAFVALDLDAEADTETVLSAVDGTSDFKNQEDTEVIDPFGIVLVPAQPDTPAESLSAATDTMRSVSGVRSTYPVFQMPNGEEDELLILVPKFRAQFKDGVSREQIDTLNAKHGVEIVDEGDVVLPNNFLLQLTAKAKKDALELANLYHDEEIVAYAEPDFVMRMRQLDTAVADNDLEELARSFEGGDGDVLSLPELAPTVDAQATANDPLFSQQWGLHKMRVPQAWDVTRGRSTITIAILDDGVQTTHPDLSARIFRPYDAVQNDTVQEPNSWDGHGTACAGIAAATANNRRGVAGVAPLCRIMPIRIAYSARRGGGWITSTSIIARGIIRAVQQGADVLSNSWGGGGASSTVRNAFRYARSSGRSGRGSISIAATGNGDRANGVMYPAKYPEVLACGASNQWDQRKSRTSRDGETWWGSNYGPEVDFVAPGVKIATTDLTGSAGYGPGDYLNTFNGTSSATPNASGVAGLVLSTDPGLRQWEVRDILRLTARDISPRGQDVATGHGRIDAFRAVQAASRLWSQVILRLEFLGAGQECYMRFRRFRLYNSGLNTIRVNSFVLRSYDPSGREIDRFTYRGTPGGVMRPGLSASGGSGDDVRFDGVLLKAHGTRRRYSYRWRANWSYTFWRPSRPITSPSDAMEAAEATAQAEFTMDDLLQGESFDEEVELVFDSEEGTHPSQVILDAPLTVASDGALQKKDAAAVNVSTTENGLAIQNGSSSGSRAVTIRIELD